MSRSSLILTLARQLGIRDPRAVLSVAAQEGLSGGIGDAGTSFGPFQLHRGGALPQHIANPHAWAWSRPGLIYALTQIKKVAGGQTGNAAIANIVRRFERPADPAGEIAKALAYYQRGGAPTQESFNVASAGTNTPSQGNILLQAIMKGGELPINVFRPRPITPLGSPSPSPVEFGPGVKATGRELAAVSLAMKFRGTPYKWGGTSPGGFDCSGLLQYVWGQKGVQIPRTTYEQIKAGTPVKSLRAGDAVFFGSKSNPHHVGMYIGNGNFIEAPHTGAAVRVSKLKGRKDFLGGRRFG